jgi:predicted nucleic-acid-binding protein
MIAIDTNVLVRFLVKDDEEQSRRAAAVIQDAVANGDHVLISDVVLVETVWVLKRSYKLKKPEIIAVLSKLLAARAIEFLSSEQVAMALKAFEKGKGGFADHFIVEQSRLKGCRSFVTFDKSLSDDAGYVVRL